MTFIALVSDQWRRTYRQSSCCSSRKRVVICAAEPVGDLSRAAFDGDVIGLQRVLQASGSAVNQGDDDGWTPLMWAARAGSEHAVRELIARGADVAVRNKFDSTAIHQAAHWGHVPVLHILLACEGAELNGRNKFGWTPLHWAAKGGHAEAVRFLVHAGADVLAKHAFGNTALHEAVNSGRVDAVEALLDSLDAATRAQLIEARNGENETALVGAAYLGVAQVVETLLQRGANPNVTDIEGNTALHRAARGGHPEAVQQLLHAGAIVDAASQVKGSTPLHEAARWGRAEVVGVLLAAGASTTARTSAGDTPLDCARAWATSWDDDECLTLLSTAG